MGRISRWGLRVIDFHAHFPVPDPYLADWEARYAARFGAHKLERLRRDARWYQERWWRAYAFPFPEEPPAPPEVQAARWAAEVDRYGLERVVFLTGGGNDMLATIVRRYPDRFIGFAHHDPFRPDAAQELYRAVRELGLRGYKILAPALRGPINDPALDPVWQACEALGIPVLIHFGVLGGGGGIAYHENINPLVLHDVAKGFPDVPFIIPHFGCGYPRELLHLCWACRNVYVDTSGNNEWVRWMPYELTLKDLFRRFVETIGPERILFGSDSEWFPRGFAVRYLEDQLRICYEIGLREEDIQKIFADNAARLLGLEGGSSSQI
ncbi:MAG: amidohydrolase [Thermoflexus sp.]|uniref:amidohydrolase family protein n=1 Tax=Thermoflexus sp. TaxID=1969742 RepID=UPI0033200D48